MPIKISGPIIEEHMAYFITDDNTSKGKDPNINIMYNFIICDQLPETEPILALTYKENSHYPTHGTKKETATYKGMENS